MLFEAVEGLDRRGGYRRKGGCRRSVAERWQKKLAAAEIIGKANPEKEKEEAEEKESEIDGDIQGIQKK